jgi:hypothetical protein
VLRRPIHLCMPDTSQSATMERPDGYGARVNASASAEQQDSGWLSDMASAFLASTGATDLLTGGEDAPLQTQDVQTQLNNLPDPAAALQVCRNLRNMPGYALTFSCTGVRAARRACIA